ncbi:hypothetical protein DPMN_193201 [Dreissena polymorpha]|uniref:Uncharacterized protein n=1 Tax=Dreissena polymorpha TaxID=45954 RepID=A0A9D3Y3R8_DREPO|nr:hypothetical protein DPMN_193201 [Dreissena polymorpha]
MNRGQGDDIQEQPKSSSDDERSILSGGDVPRLFSRRPACPRSTVTMKPEVYNGDGDWEVCFNPCCQPTRSGTILLCDAQQGTAGLVPGPNT